jgi:5-methylcytosine-specific restriction endonuclease McrA
VAVRRRKVKELLVHEAGGQCMLCGYDSYLGALQFHHLDPSEKQFHLGLRGITRSLERMRAEAAKCVLLCSNCHAEVEGGVRSIVL